MQEGDPESMSDEEWLRRVHRQFDYRSIIDRVVYVLILIVGFGPAVAFYFTAFKR